ncbi:MAG: hypothetical protein D6B26_02030 [Spirochaetaceae bacterium]|nr:MAG: hypothetical protein D6B26_02030 [Spirochaetaceae bacterium]
MKGIRSGCMLIILAILPAAFAGAIGWEFRAGPMWAGNAFHTIDTPEGSVKVQGSAVSPLRTIPGAAFLMPLSPMFTLNIGLDAMLQEYLELPEGSPAPGKVVPTDSHVGSDSDYLEPGESQNVAAMLLLPLHIGVEASVISNPLLYTGPGAGITLIPGIPFLIEGETTSGILSWHYGAGRFLFPELNWFVTFKNFAMFDYGLRLRSIWPLSNIWAATEYAGWWDRLHIQLQFFVRI